MALQTLEPLASVAAVAAAQPALLALEPQALQLALPTPAQPLALLEPRALQQCSVAQLQERRALPVSLLAAQPAVARRALPQLPQELVAPGAASAPLSPQPPSLPFLLWPRPRRPHPLRPDPGFFCELSPPRPRESSSSASSFL